jgi:hypothetical protein
MEALHGLARLPGCQAARLPGCCRSLGSLVSRNQAYHCLPSQALPPWESGESLSLVLPAFTACLYCQAVPVGPMGPAGPPLLFCPFQVVWKVSVGVCSSHGHMRTVAECPHGTFLMTSACAGYKKGCKPPDAEAVSRPRAQAEPDKEYSNPWAAMV